jgi:hypothetical protein
MDERARVICIPVAKQANPQPGSVVRWCHICADEVWLSQSSIRDFAHIDYVTVCTACSLGEIALDAEPEIIAAPEIMRALRATGATEDEIQDLLLSALRLVAAEDSTTERNNDGYTG